MAGTTLQRVRCPWTGSGVPGGGVSTFYVADPDLPNLSALREFFAANQASFPTTVSVNFPNSGDIIDVASGQITGTWSVPGTVTGVGGTYAGEYAAGIGAQVRWLTGHIVNGRRVQGSTFLAPMALGIFDTDGTLDASVVSGLTTAGQTLLGAQPTLAVYSRPKPARQGAHGTLPAVVGSYGVVTAVKVPDRPSWLRSRRQ